MARPGQARSKGVRISDMGHYMRGFRQVRVDAYARWARFKRASFADLPPVHHNSHLYASFNYPPVDGLNAVTLLRTANPFSRTNNLRFA